MASSPREKRELWLNCSCKVLHPLQLGQPGSSVHPWTGHWARGLAWAPMLAQLLDWRKLGCSSQKMGKMRDGQLNPWAPIAGACNPRTLIKVSRLPWIKWTKCCQEKPRFSAVSSLPMWNAPWQAYSGTSFQAQLSSISHQGRPGADFISLHALWPKKEPRVLIGGKRKFKGKVCLLFKNSVRGDCLTNCNVTISLRPTSVCVCVCVCSITGMPRTPSPTTILQSYPGSEGLEVQKSNLFYFKYSCT